MRWSSHISEFENYLPNTAVQVEKALNLYDELIPQKRGKVVFLTGERGSGRSEALKVLADVFPGEYKNLQVISGKFRDGKYLASSTESGGFSRNADVIGNILAFLAKVVALKTGLPIDIILQSTSFLADFIGQMLQTSATVKAALDELGKHPPDEKEIPLAIKRILQIAVQDSPLVCLFENFDEAKQEWHVVLGSIAEEIAKDLPILFFVSLQGAANVGEHQKQESNLEDLTRRLVSRGLAEWWYLRPMTREEIAEWISADTQIGMVAKLHGITGGIPRWVIELWREWKTGAFVTFNETPRRWEWVETKTPALNPVNDIFRDILSRLLKTDSAKEIDKARELLATAALEGTQFTAEALALAIDRDIDEVINFIDDHLEQNEENPGGIVLDEGFRTFEPEAGMMLNVSRYSFVSDWHWRVLNRYAFTDEEKKAKSVEMITALQIVYEGNEQIAAGSLAELYKNIGDRERTKHFETMASFSRQREALYKEAVLLLSFSEDGHDKYKCYQMAMFLNETGSILYGAFPYEEVNRIFEGAERFARKAAETSIQANAMGWSGQCYFDLGDNKTAGAKAGIAYKLFAGLRNKSGIARCLSLMAQISKIEGDLPDAKQKALKALEIERESDHRWNVASLLFLLAQIANEEGDLPEAKQKAWESLEISRKIDSRKNIGGCLYLLAQIAQDGGDLPEAKQKVIESLEIAREVGNKANIAPCLFLLAQIAKEEGDLPRARQKVSESLEINLESGGKANTAACFHLLAQIAMREGNPTEAKQKVLKSLDIDRKIGRKKGIAFCLDFLAEIIFNEGKYVSAIDFAALSCVIFTSIGHGQREKSIKDFAYMGEKSGYSAEQLIEALEKAKAEYEKDEGDEMMDRLLKHL